MNNRFSWFGKNADLSYFKGNATESLSEKTFGQFTHNLA
jgi:hypothetical protein